MLVLGIESSCDETGVALVEAHGAAVPVLLADALHSQVEMHQAYGGVVPELASRDHIRRVLPLSEKVLQGSGRRLEEVDVVAYTSGGPGRPLWGARRGLCPGRRTGPSGWAAPRGPPLSQFMAPIPRPSPAWRCWFPAGHPADAMAGGALSLLGETSTMPPATLRIGKLMGGLCRAPGAGAAGRAGRPQASSCRGVLHSGTDFSFAPQTRGADPGGKMGGE